MNGAQQRIRLGDRCFRQRNRNAEIGNFDAILIIDQNILWLDVPVDDPVFMGQCHSR
jgi:hypothetical protein